MKNTGKILLYAGPSSAKGAVNFLHSFGFLALHFHELYSQQSTAKGIEWEADYFSAARYIKPNSVVLPLSFSHNGLDEKGRLISDCNWIFPHAADYLGSTKPLIIVDNYEANTAYFPLIWRQDVNPYWHLSAAEGFESQQPYAAIETYTSNTKVRIDYVVTWGYSPSLLGFGHVKQLMQEIDEHYRLVYSSPTGRSRLYERNN